MANDSAKPDVHWLIDDEFTLESQFFISEAERRVIAAAPFNHTPGGWIAFAWFIHRCVLDSFRKGEIDFYRMMTVMRSCSLGCPEYERRNFLSLTVDRALRLPHRKLNRSKPPFAPWQRQSAVELVLYLESLHPGRLDRENREEALAWLTSLGLATENNIRRRPLADRTLELWVVKHRKNTGSARRKGRRSRR